MPLFIHDRGRLVRHEAVAVQFPIYWYSTPALLKEWFDLVWLHGFAYGQGGDALRGKRLMAVCTTGGDELAYGPETRDDPPEPRRRGRVAALLSRMVVSRPGGRNDGTQTCARRSARHRFLGDSSKCDSARE